jgi:hypothetical protein
MKGCIIAAVLFAGLAPLGGQTVVTKKTAAKSNDYGITYSLPKTKLIINAEVFKTTCKAGPYFRYAEKYLGIKESVAEDKTSYRLGKISLVNKGVADAENTYIVEFRSGTAAPYACLTEDGLLCSINAEYEPPGEVSGAPASEMVEQGAKAPAFTEELLMAGSTAKQAEVAAKLIYRIRDSRLNILTGEADNLPPDGEAMKLVIRQLEEQEKALTELFAGTCSQEISYYDVSIVPYGDMEKEVLFRFSEALGITDADDLSGAPAYITLKAIDREAPLPPKEAEKKEKQMKGLIYNVPGKAGVEIEMNRKSLYKGETQVAQFGRRENLVPAVFENKKTPVKIFFYPETGAIRQIIQ